MKKFFVLLIVFALFVSESFAQPGFDDDVEDAPIPGGAILIGFAIIFGMYKMYKFRKEKNKLIST